MGLLGRESQGCRRHLDARYERLASCGSNRTKQGVNLERASEMLLGVPEGRKKGISL